MTRQKAWSLRNPGYDREWRRKNRQKVNAQKRQRRAAARVYWRAVAKRARDKKVAFIQGIKAAPCVDCRQTYPPHVMHFDHREPSTKLKNLSQMATYSYEKIGAEIAKCDLVCANCHAVRTHRGIQTGKIKVFGRYKGE